MDKTVYIPETLNDLTLDQLQRLENVVAETDYEIKARAYGSIVYGLSGREVERANKTDIDKLIQAVDKVLVTEPEITLLFEHNGVKLGFIPNLEKITTAEWVDLETLGFSADTLHRLMQILYRPVTFEQGNVYKIAPYDPDNLQDLKQMPAGVAKGALLFFCRLGLDCTNAIQSLQEKTPSDTKPGEVSIKSGAGMQA